MSGYQVEFSISTLNLLHRLNQNTILAQRKCINKSFDTPINCQ